MSPDIATWLLALISIPTLVPRVVSAPVQSALLISNAQAGSVSARSKEVIIKALQADFKLEVADTERRDHAGDLARDAADQGLDGVLVFGGDGTINETAQGLVGSDVALGLLPGGTANVMARSLGVPRNPVDATAFVAAKLRSGTRRRVNVGRMNDRHFLFSAGMGLDAEVVRRVEATPKTARAHGVWTWVRTALIVAVTEYRGARPSITMAFDDETDDEPSRVVLAICANARPFTYFRQWPVDALPEAGLDRGLDFFGITKVRLLTIPRITYSLFVSRSHIRWKNARYRHDAVRGRLEADRPMPLQVDGDFIGLHTRAELALVPNALSLLV
jgi:diacylglycerol kinase family enzyme